MGKKRRAQRPSKVRLSYRGPWGRKSFPALISNVGRFYYTEIGEFDLVSVETIKRDDGTVETRWHILGPKGMPAVLSSDEWQPMDSTCQYRLGTGEFCQETVGDGESYCEFHKKLIGDE